MIIPLITRLSLWKKIVYEISIDKNLIIFTIPFRLIKGSFQEIEVEAKNIVFSSGAKTKDKSILSKEEYDILSLSNGKKLYLIKSFWDDYSEILKQLKYES